MAPLLSPPVPPRAQPLGVNRIDHQIRLRNGSTSVLALSPQRLQLDKQNPPSNLSARVEELTKELGQLRQEIQFYRQSFENLQRLRETGYDVYQQIYLVLHLGLDSERLYQLMIQLHRALEDSVRREVKAEKAWLEFWGIKYNDKDVKGELI